MYIALCFAPTELGLFCDRCSYKHSAPTELTRLVAAPPRCAIRVNLWLFQSMRPGITLQRPLIAGIFFAQFFRDFAENGVIVRRFVMTYAPPVHGFSGHSRISIILADTRVSLLSVGPFLVHERDSSQAHFQTRAEPVLWQIAFDAIAFNAV